MTIKQVEPLKFKGNKVYYLHKLSEKGAVAIKCDFPNGDNTFTETTLQAAIEELATNGGGGSAESLIPKRVIYINPDKETVAGECYHTFAAAKAYMETYPEQKFCVELPAGDFGTTADDHITLSEQWEIHGNKTKIVAPIDTKIVDTGDFSGVLNTNRSICNCTISEGFVTDAGAQEIKCYHIYDCTILKLSADTGGTPTTAALLVFNSAIKTGDESGTSAKWYLGHFQNCFVQNFESESITTIPGAPGFEFVCSYVMQSKTHNSQTQYVDCQIGFTNGTGLEVSNESADGTAFVCCQVKGGTLKGKLFFCNSCVLFSRINNVTGISARKSYLRYIYVDENLVLPSLEMESSIFSANITNENVLTISSLNCDAISEIASDNGTGISLPTRNMNIVYSTDGGTTMSNDPTGATHYGICKDLTETTVSVSNYMWFAIPVGE